MGRVYLFYGYSLLLLSVSGCTFFNRTRSGHDAETAAATSQAQVVRDSLALPPIIIKAAKSSQVRVEIPPPAPSHVQVSTQGENSSESSSSWFSKTKLPLSIAIGVGALSLVLLLVAVNLWRRSSAAFSAAYSGADEALAGGIRSLRSWAQTTDNHQEMAQASNLIAEFEAHRGKLRGKGKP